MTIYYMAKILLYQNEVEVRSICIRIFVQLIKINIVTPFLSRGSLV